MRRSSSDPGERGCPGIGKAPPPRQRRTPEDSTGPVACPGRSRAPGIGRTTPVRTARLPKSDSEAAPRRRVAALYMFGQRWVAELPELVEDEDDDDGDGDEVVAARAVAA